MKKMIFYHPHPIVENPQRGSELRPKKMKEAFENIGYQVDLAVGDSRQRKAAFKQIKKNIKGGKIYDFMYAESSNMPIPLTDSHHLPLKPLLDYKFFRFLNKKSIPIGFFYRDLYWQDKKFNHNALFFKYFIKQSFHWLEWFGIKETVDYLFLPTREMSKYLPAKWPENHLGALYPGCEPVSLSPNTDKQQDDSMIKSLTLFYVGGVAPPYYDLSPMFSLLQKVEGIKLIICCREEEWKKNLNYYRNVDFIDINIVHANSSQIYKYYEKADIFFDLRKSEGYLKTTIPIKIFETIGYQLPLFLFSGTAYSEFVEKEGAGWVVETIEEAEELLKELRDDKNKILDKTKNLQKISKQHAWGKRAEQARETLKNVGFV